MVYNKTGVVKTAELNVDWFIDEETFNGTDEINSFSSPILYLYNAVQWTTYQKEKVSISIPITSENLVLELLDYISYSDKINTNNVLRYGWITKINVDFNNFIMNIDLTLLPTDYPSINIIDETCFTTNSIDEITTGNNIIDETGV